MDQSGSGRTSSGGRTPTGSQRQSAVSGSSSYAPELDDDDLYNEPTEFIRPPPVAPVAPAAEHEYENTGENARTVLEPPVAREPMPRSPTPPIGRRVQNEAVQGTPIEELPFFWPTKKHVVEKSLKDSGILGVYVARNCSQEGHYAITGISANIGLASLLFREEIEHNRYIYYAEINHVDRRFHSVTEVVQQFNKEKNLSFSMPLNYTP